MYKYLLYIIIAFSVPVHVCAQQPVQKTSADYISLIKKSARDSLRMDLYYDLGCLYLNKIEDYYNPQDIYGDSAEWAFTLGAHLADSLHSTRRQYHLKRMLAATFFYRRKIEAGKIAFMELIDSFRKKGEREKEAATWQLMAETREKNDSSIPDIEVYHARAMELFRALGQKESEARTLLTLADLHLTMAKMRQAEDEALQALHTYQQANSHKLYDSYYLLSAINRYQGDLGQALLYATLCVQNVDSLHDDAINSPFFYGELALVYDALGQAEESAKWYRLTLEGRKKRQEIPLFILRTAGLLIHQLVKLNKGPEALAVVHGIQKDYPPSTKLQRANLAQYFGYCYQALGDYGKAETYFLEMLSESEVSPDYDEFVSMAYQDIGNFYLATKKFDKAARFLAKALNPTNSFLVSRQRDIYLSLYTADSALGNYLAAINDFRSYKKLTDSIFSERKSHQIEELQIKFQTEKKEKDIILLNSQNKAQESKMQRSALIRNSIIAGVLLLAGILYYRYRLKSISNKKMQEQQRLIHQKNLSLTQLVTEKEWLVKEIHHRVKNNFHTVMGLLATQSQFLRNPEAVSAMRESRHRIQAMSLIHQKLYQSDNLSTIAMPPYIHELVNSLRESFEIPGSVQFKVDIDPVSLDLSHAIPLGLILNEAITNAIKYAFPGGRTGSITISIKEEPDNHCVATVQDNGIGFPVAPTGEHSMGMKLMKGLSEDMEASIHISGDHGTMIQIAFLYEPEKNDSL